MSGKSNPVPVSPEDETRPGYKWLKHIGWIPEDWEAFQLSAIAKKLKRGPSKKTNAEGKGIIYLTSDCINEEGIIRIDRPKYLEKTLIDDLDKYLIKPNDLLVNCVNSLDQIGKVAVFEGHDSSVMVGFNNFALTFKPNVDSNLIKHILSYGKYSNILKKISKPAVQQVSFSSKDLLKINIPLPKNIDERNKISEFISSWDASIISIQSLITAKTEQKLGLMQQLLTGKTRFPKYIHSNNAQETKYGDIPTDWDYLSIIDFASQISDKNSNGNGLPVLSCTKYDGLVDSLKYFKRRVFSDDTSSYKIVKRNQFAYATNHIEEGSIGYQDLYDEALISPMYTVFETDDSINDSYLYKILKTELYRHIFEVNTSASVNRRGSLRWKQFSKIKVPFPSYDEQGAIAQVIDTADHEINLLNKKLAALKLQKKGLMQKLLTGEVRVNV